MAEGVKSPESSEQVLSAAPILGERTTPPTLGRRRFLGILGKTAKVAGVAVTLDSVYSHIPSEYGGGNGFTRDFWENLERQTFNVSPEQVKKLIEDKFSVQLLSPKTGYTEFKNTARTYQAVEWDAPRLKALYETLSILPPNYYTPKSTPDGKETKLGFALVDRTSDGSYDMAARCVCDGGSNPLVLLNKVSTNQTLPYGPGKTKNLVVHEVTHAVTTPQLEQYTDAILKPIGIENNDQLRATFRTRNARNLFGLKRDSKLQYGSSNLGEFLSVGAEFYVLGKDKFVRTYKDDLGEEKVIKLYNSFKETLFKGKEYS